MSVRVQSSNYHISDIISTGRKKNAERARQRKHGVQGGWKKGGKGEGEWGEVRKGGGWRKHGEEWESK